MQQNITNILKTEQPADVKYKQQQQQQHQFYFFGLNTSTLVNTDTVRPGVGEKTLQSSRLPPPNHLLSKNLNERTH